MFLKPSNFIFLIILVMSTFMVVSSSSWINSWLSLEINLMSLIPILINNQNYKSTSSSIKYFLVQAMASMLLVMVVILYYNFNMINYLNLNNEIIMISLTMKSGIPPFHFWLPQVVETSEMIQNFLILSWQKIAPFMMFSYCMSNMMMIVIITGGVTGAIGGINQNSLKKILAYSSMTHGSWMLASMMIKQNLWVIYFLIYNLSLIVMCFLMEKFNFKKITEMTNNKIDSIMKFVFLLSLLSMAGLPPFVGFFGKLLIILSTIFSYKMMMVLSLLISSSLISLIYYMKICYATFLMNEKKMFLKKTFLNKTSVVTMILLMNLLGPSMVYLT